MAGAIDRDDRLPVPPRPRGLRDQTRSYAAYTDAPAVPLRRPHVVTAELRGGSLLASRGGSFLASVQELVRDAIGRIVERTELLDGTTRVTAYSHDDAGRLSSVTQDGLKLGSFSYDGNGNRLGDGEEAGTYDERDRVVAYGSRTHTHDARGNRTSMSGGGTVVTYEHDARGALRTVKNGALNITYDVDAWGRRVARRENGSVSHRWLYRSALQPVAEYDASNKLRWRFVYSPGRHVPEAAMDSSGATYKIVTDQVGSLRLVVRGSDGAVVQRMRHDAWGRVEEDYVSPAFAALPFGFAGGLFDRGTSLVHFGLREYDPQLGRWVERDPVGLGGGLNPYAYAGNSPVGHTDHAGLWRDDDPRIDRYNASMAAASDAERAGVMVMVGLAATPLAIEVIGAAAIEAGVATEAAAVAGFLRGLAGDPTGSIRWPCGRPGVSLGERFFLSSGGQTGLASERIIKNGSTLIFENFTVLSTSKGRDLVGPAKELLAFAEQHNAKFLTFEGTFSNAELAAKFGKATGDSFAITVEATRQGLLGALKQVGQ